MSSSVARAGQQHGMQQVFAQHTGGGDGSEDALVSQSAEGSKRSFPIGADSCVFKEAKDDRELFILVILKLDFSALCLRAYL